MTVADRIREYLEQHPGYVPLVDLRAGMRYGHDTGGKPPLLGVVRLMQVRGLVETAGGWEDGSFRVRIKAQRASKETRENVDL